MVARQKDARQSYVAGRVKRCDVFTSQCGHVTNMREKEPGRAFVAGGEKFVTSLRHSGGTLLTCVRLLRALASVCGRR